MQLNASYYTLVSVCILASLDNAINAKMTPVTNAKDYLIAHAKLNVICLPDTQSARFSYPIVT